MNIKKIISVLLLIVVLCTILCACSSPPSSTEETKKEDIRIESIPYSMDFGGISVPLSRVAFYEEYANHGYIGYVIVKLDRKNLTDDDIYWMINYNQDTLNTEISVNAYLEDEDENSYDIESLTSLGKFYSDEYLYFVFATDKNRYSLKNREFSIQIIHSPTKLIAPDTQYFYYDFDLTGSNYSDSVNSLTEEELDILNQALTE